MPQVSLLLTNIPMKRIYFEGIVGNIRNQYNYLKRFFSSNIISVTKRKIKCSYPEGISSFVTLSKRGMFVIIFEVTKCT